jgi:hypothetical protein
MRNIVLLLFFRVKRGAQPLINETEKGLGVAAGAFAQTDSVTGA